MTSGVTPVAGLPLRDSSIEQALSYSICIPIPVHLSLYLYKHDTLAARRSFYST
jgi:hypothetical protein